jgi:hypothetical protein
MMASSISAQKFNEIYKRREKERINLIESPVAFDSEGGFSYHHHEDATNMGKTYG